MMINKKLPGVRIVGIEVAFFKLTLVLLSQNGEHMEFCLFLGPFEAKVGLGVWNMYQT